MNIWQDLNPRERMMHLLNTGHLSDCSFVVFDEEGNQINLKCHKFVLMYTSPVFERMFDGDFEESKKSDNIVLDDVSGTDFQKFIEYLYWHDNQRLNQYELTTLQTLIYLSKKFMVTSLTTNCIISLRRRLAIGLDPDTTVDLYQYAHQIESEALIISIAQKLINFPTDYIYTPAVFELSPEIFLKFITHFGGNISEKKRFSVINHYCKIQNLVPSNESLSMEQVETKTENTYHTEVDMTLTGKKTCRTDGNQNDIKDEVVDKKANSFKSKEEKEEYLTRLLKSVQFTFMTPYEFCVGPGKSHLLSESAKFSLLSSICVAQHKSNTIMIQKSL